MEKRRLNIIASREVWLDQEAEAAYHLAFCFQEPNSVVDLIKFVGSKCGSRCARGSKRERGFSWAEREREVCCWQSCRTRTPEMEGLTQTLWHQTPQPQKICFSHAGWEGPNGTVQTGNKYISSSDI